MNKYDFDAGLGDKTISIPIQNWDEIYVVNDKLFTSYGFRCNRPSQKWKKPNKTAASLQVLAFISSTGPFPTTKHSELPVKEVDVKVSFEKEGKKFVSWRTEHGKENETIF